MTMALVYLDISILIVAVVMGVYPTTILFVRFVCNMTDYRIFRSQEISNKQFREAPCRPDPDVYPEPATSVS